ncbi:fructose-bisphosphate aldolase class II [Caldicellulosiruptor bescii]|uniref:Ketose-bisphosphate aldolase n=2 Tax=Caldicellulosiruptor bescii TaxID=31899 RepID=B9MNC8_CALBD|nr:class II fructose-bisphosphate aldolase [Caldicellulosiruptor bescii]ACM61459.1 ketose-bisphosphate aldolase [Caldicellulosiruptor bescii DSM 6725]PBC88728.1 fructose-bisphosphate aldolase class II [Caldicellulosiruptor bescii]PBC91791.1 fructose-bisphosphate aldolase class II [Caldicellulosiruptor bescii]PBD02798.1 fructose-bisphosphate aldolase class II [Caldicellulosiruptor bescii]PBD07586.1 fructose-bisphosphate aldolase class II [Caldicellulosiruptor bescii]
MLVNLNQVLSYTKVKKFGVGMFNGLSADFYEGLIDAAEQLRCPIIIGVADRFVDRLDFEMIAEVMIFLAKRASVPVCVHLDHAKSLKNIMRAIKAGFTSVMFDGSSLPFEENIKRTREVVEIAHSVGVSVEGELGVVGRGDFDFKNPEFYTKPDEAEEFAQKTQVDALAVSIGTVHGVYKGQPRLDFERLSEIRKRVDCYLVLHGGSGLSDDDFKKCIEYGINKINIFTDLTLAINAQLPEFIKQTEDLTTAIFEKIREIVKLEAIKKLKIFGSYNIL